MYLVLQLNYCFTYRGLRGIRFMALCNGCNGNRTELESNSVCNHTSDKKNRRPRINNKNYNFRQKKKSQVIKGNVAFKD